MKLIKSILLLNHLIKTDKIEHKFLFYEKGVTRYDQNSGWQHFRGK